MKFVFKFAALCVIVILLFILGKLIYFKLTYIDEKIIIGQGFGFKIGDTKEDTFQNIIKNYQDQNVFILYPLDGKGYGPHRKLKFKQDDYKLIQDRAKWVFYFTEDFFDSLDLTFKDNNLIEIYRHRKKFELP